MRRLQNKTAIITGGAHGIGQAIVRRFCQEGATVCIADLDQTAGRALAKQLAAKKQQAIFVRCDVSSAMDVEKTAKAAMKATGAIDILVNNAAYLAPWHNCIEASDEEWEKCLRVSLVGTQHFTRAVLPSMIQQKGGSIINISSVQGLVAGRNSVAYTTVKHALIGFTRSVACDYGPHNIRCNVLCPGAIRTRISPEPGSELHQRQISKTFLGRTGETDEVATVAAFLASDESSYITGAVLPVDGGWTAM